MGKTSLLNHLLPEIRTAGWKCARIDLANFTGLKKRTWFARIGDELGERLGCKPQHRVRDALDFKSYLKDQVLVPSSSELRLALFFDEIGGLISYSFSESFLAVLRALYNERDDYSPHCLLVGFAGAVDHRSLIKDPYQSPFNVARNITLDDFTPKESRNLTSHLDNGSHVPLGDGVHECIYDWTSGHPYLTQFVCQRLEERAFLGRLEAITCAEVDRVVKETILGPQSEDLNVDHVRSQVDGLGGVPASLWQRVISGKTVNALDEGYPTLYLTGAVTAREDGSVVIRNRIYRKVFQVHS
jgi:hypothetical protein